MNNILLYLSLLFVELPMNVLWSLFAFLLLGWLFRTKSLELMYKKAFYRNVSVYSGESKSEQTNNLPILIFSSFFLPEYTFNWS